MDSTLEAARLAVFDFITDTLVDLIDPAPDEVQEIRDTMMNAAEILMEGLGMEVTEVNDDGSLVVNMDLGEEIS